MKFRDIGLLIALGTVTASPALAQRQSPEAWCRQNGYHPGTQMFLDCLNYRLRDDQELHWMVFGQGLHGPLIPQPNVCRRADGTRCN